MSDPRPGADYIKTIREQRAEIERLTACVEHHQAVEADQERAIERLQSELGVWKANAETNLGEVERLQKHHAEAQHKIGEYVDLTARLRSALERIVDDWEKGRDPINKSVDYPVDIAREALRDD